MRVSFDLDDVLFVSPDRFETEPPPHAPFDLIFKERLRKGTVDLIHTLQNEGFEVWVYTSSFRSERYLRALFSRYRIHFDEIVNAQRHLREVQRDRPQILPQKCPAFTAFPSMSMTRMSSTKTAAATASAPSACASRTSIGPKRS